MAALPGLFDVLSAAGDATRIGLSIGLIAPLALVMGMPFPLGLASVAAKAESLLPWAWAINGFASVHDSLMGR